MSVAILALLQASGIQQIIPPIKAANGELTQHTSDFTLTVYPFVNGQNGLCYNLTDDQWITLGKVLRQALLLTTAGGADRLVMYKHFVDMFEPNGVVDIAFKTDIDPQARLISSEKEKKAALDFRQKHFFDRLNIQDPYAWTLDQKDHLHWLLYDGDEIIGYAHVQMWPDHRAALRIIVIDDQRRGQGMGKWLMDHCEQELEQRGVTLLQTEASPNAYLFYKKLGYVEMPFNNPDGEATHPEDRAMGKYL